MSMFSADLQHLDRWLDATVAHADDPAAVLPDTSRDPAPPNCSNRPECSDHEERRMRSPIILGVAGSVRRPSRTAALVAAVVEAIGEHLGTPGRTIELGDRGAAFFDALQRDAMRGRAREIVEAIEAADVLVVGTPVYRASYTGLFKHVFDLVDHEALAGKAVVLTATGGSPMHGLVMEHQLRPLFGFFRAHTMPSAVYATEADFEQYALASPALRDRVARAAEEVARLVGRSHSVLSGRRHDDMAAVA
jgi:FMN reductase